MNNPKRTDSGPEDFGILLERALEQAEQRIEAQIDSIAGNDVADIDPEEAAGCTVPRASAARAPGAEGVQPSNTPPSSSQNNEIENWIGSEDWLEWSVYVQWNHEWEELRERLQRAKEYAGIENAPIELYQILFMGGTATVAPGGVREGKASFKYRLYFDELTVLIADRLEPHKTFPSVMIRATGEACLSPGAWECYEKGTQMIKALGGTIIRNRLSRVDICLDMPGVPIDLFRKPFSESRYISLSRNDYEYRPQKGNGGTTLYFGKSPLQCRIYDKLKEVEQKANPHKKLCMQVYRWGGFPKEATRIEFELRREALKRRGIDSVEDYYEKRADLVQYLTVNWLRFTAGKVDREHKNQTRTRTLPLWNRVRKAFKQWAGEPQGQSLAPLPKEQADVRNLLKQLVGVGQTAAGYQGKELLTIEELIAYIKASALKYELKPKRRK